MSSPESQSQQSSEGSPSTVKTWACPACPKVCYTSSGRTHHMRNHHDHLAPCASCALPKCILPICPMRKHCHGEAHGGPARRPSPPTSESSNPTPEWQIEQVAVAEELSAFNQDEFDDVLMAMNDGQPVAAASVWPRSW